MNVNFNTQQPRTSFGMAVKFDEPASEYLQSQASKRMLNQLAKIMKSEENKPDILLQRKEIIAISGPGCADTVGHYWKAEVVDNKNLYATARWFNAPIRALNKLINKRNINTTAAIQQATKKTP